MEYNDRRLAELAALDAHRRAAQYSSPTDPASVFRLGTFTHTMAQELLLESLVSYREAIARLEAAGDRGEAWERAHALVALNHLMLGDRARARAAIDAILTRHSDSPSALAILAEFHYREGNNSAGRACLDRIPPESADHPVAGAILTLHRNE